MVLHQHSGCVVGIDLADVQDLVNDDIARLQFIVPLHFFLSHVPCTRNVLIEVVGMRGSDVGNITSGLCEGGCVGGVGMYHTLDSGECSI